jgi:hypothetical protein
VIPSDRKWYRNLSVARVIVDTLKTFDMRYPKEVPDIDSFRSRLQKMVEEDPA